MKRKKLKAKLTLSLLIACLVTSTANALSPNIDLDKSGENTDLSLTEEIGYAGIIKLDPNHKLTIESNGNGIYSGWNKDAKFDIIADDIEIITHSGNGIYMSLENEGNGILTIGEEAETGRKINNLTINSHGQGIDNKNGSVTIYGSDESKISIHSDGYKGDYNEDQSAVNTGRLKDEYYPAKTGSTFIEGGTIELSSDGGSGTLTRTEDSSTTIIAHNSISISSNHLHPENSNPDNGIYVYKKIENAGINNIAGTTTVEAKNDISITSSQYGILAQSGTVDVKSTAGSNIIRAFTAITPEGDSAAAEETAEEEAAETEKRDAVAVYAKDNAVINLTAGTDGVNYIATEIAKKDSTANERTIWAQRGGKINIKGQTFIIASNANIYTEDTIEGEEQVKGNAVGIAITAGSEQIPDTGKNDKGEIIGIDDTLRSHVTVEYNNANNGPLNSFISGDIVSGYGGLIDIQDTDNSGLDLMGNALAANGGKLNLDLGNGGTWLGRADDYGDAGVINDNEATPEV